jgi:hypothetical protein
MVQLFEFVAKLGQHLRKVQQSMIARRDDRGMRYCSENSIGHERCLGHATFTNARLLFRILPLPGWLHVVLPTWRPCGATGHKATKATRPILRSKSNAVKTQRESSNQKVCLPKNPVLQIVLSRFLHVTADPKNGFELSASQR